MCLTYGNILCMCTCSFLGACIWHVHMYIYMSNFFSITFVKVFDSILCFYPAVSSYSPEVEFPHNVLTRLEAVMGIQIVSVLAERHSTLTSSSGVELRPHVDDDGDEIALPNPNTEPAKYVEEVIFQWSAGRSRRFPTWRQLLTVLQDIGLVDLSQQIQEFIKGKNHYFPRLL